MPAPRVLGPRQAAPPVRLATRGQYQVATVRATRDTTMTDRARPASVSPTINAFFNLLRSLLVHLRDLLWAVDHLYFLYGRKREDAFKQHLPLQRRLIRFGLCHVCR